MATTQPTRNRIQALKKVYDTLRPGKESLLSMIDEVEVPESVYNSNAIENSTLTLKETERILLEQMLSRNVSVREVFEAKNLARVTEYKRARTKDSELSKSLILLLHQMLIGGIDDAIAGRFRQQGEYVRVGPHIAPAPEHVERMMDNILIGTPATSAPISSTRSPDFTWILSGSIPFATATAAWGGFSSIFSSCNWDCRALSSATRKSRSTTGHSRTMKTATRPGLWKVFWRWRS